ncbi:ECF transporter S component [Streptomyces sp. DSM 40750]|uniref:ECF transporter S component n=1 Tax=Streptomyces sp. DSM 40750 TaxID=2801030 RepID=UPI00214C316E|nr:ECF transporter S component [Streptomyces sp. DSM 40750]UUU23839.1 ECF transporter S component [Streptomyces sp. DSM 40750]
MLPRNALSRRIRKAGAAVRAGLFLVLALIALTLAAPTSASADFTCDFTGDETYHRDSPGSNGEAFIPTVAQWSTAPLGDLLSEDTATEDLVKPKDAGRYTLYELNGMRGLNWSMTFKDEDDARKNNGEWFSGADDCQLMTWVNNGMANIIFNGTKVLTRFSISVKEMASNPSPFAALYKGRDSAVSTLKSHVLEPAVPVMIVLVGFWVFAKWRKGDMREVWAGISWTGLTTIAVIAVLSGTNYNLFVSGADKWIAEANSTLTSTALSSVSGTPQPPCDLNDDRGNEGLRLSSCAMYDTLAFRPWALGQFGEAGNTCIFRLKSDESAVANGHCPDKVPDGVSIGVPDHSGCYWGTEGSTRCADLRVRQAVTQSTTDIDTRKVNGGDLDQFYDWTLIRKDIARGTYYPVPYPDWAGMNAADRVGIAFYSLIAAFIVGVMVLVLSALTLLWHAVTLILIIMLPLVATLGIHPSQQKLLKGWLETFIHSFVLRAGFGVILTVLLVLYQIILPAPVALGTQLLMLVLVTAAVVMMLKKLLAGNFSPEFAGGGGDALGIRDGASAGSEKVVGKGEAAMANATKASGRVVGKTAAVGANLLTGRKGRQALQKRGWIGMSQREQRKASYAAYKSGQEQPKGNKDSSPAEAEPPQSPPSTSSSRGGRVSGSSGQPSSQTPQTSPSSQATQNPQTSQQTQEPKPEPTTPRPRTQAPEPSPAPRPPAPPTPAPRDPRTPDGRV